MGKLHTFKPTDSAAAVQDVLDQLQAGDRVVFTPGIYRMALRVTAKGTADAPLRGPPERPDGIFWLRG
jgi:hypothetical protein